MMSSSPNPADIKVVAPAVESADQSLTTEVNTKPIAIAHHTPDTTLSGSPLPHIECSPGEHPPSSMASSTPYSVKSNSSIKIVDDPFHTPGNTESSGDVSFTTPSTGPDSTSSTSLEIFLGPQPLSYIHHRRRLLAAEMEASPSRQKPGDIGSLPLPKHSNPLAAINHSDESEETPRALPAAPTSKPEDISILSKWRQEQLKKAKPIRPVAGARERPIPLLHGPLSLPYARNPSGVDATVSDQNAYMANVFGVRAVESADEKPEKKLSKHLREPNPSGSRNVSSSSYHSVSSGMMSDSSIAAGATRRPLIIRDYHQIIGIKKEGAPRLVAQVNSGEIPSSFLPHDAHNQQTMQHLDLHSHLGVGYPYAHDYIQQVPVMPSPDYAIHSASGAMWQLPQDGLGVPGFPYSPLQLVDPNTKTVYSVQIPSNINSIESKAAYSHQYPHLSASKAEASINWRNKVPNNTPAKYPHGSPQSKVMKPSVTASPMAAGGGLAEVLTVDHLYKRFGQHALKPRNENISHLPLKPYMTDKASEGPVHVEPTKPAESPVKTLRDVSRKVNLPEESPTKAVSRRKGRGSGSSRNSTGNGRAKGTPGAGKFLKHSATDDEGTPSKTVTSDSHSVTSSPKPSRSGRHNNGRRHPVAV